MEIDLTLKYTEGGPAQATRHLDGERALEEAESFLGEALQKIATPDRAPVIAVGETREIFVVIAVHG